MIAGVFATSAISIVVVMAARSGKLGWSGIGTWSLSECERNLVGN